MKRGPRRGRRPSAPARAREARSIVKSRPEEMSQVRLPNQAAPVRRTVDSCDPFRSETSPEEICKILSPRAAARCMTDRLF
jgi:hypothetical protein